MNCTFYKPSPRLSVFYPRSWCFFTLNILKYFKIFQRDTRNSEGLIYTILDRCPSVENEPSNFTTGEIISDVDKRLKIIKSQTLKPIGSSHRWSIARTSATWTDFSAGINLPIGVSFNCRGEYILDSAPDAFIKSKVAGERGERKPSMAVWISRRRKGRERERDSDKQSEAEGVGKTLPAASSFLLRGIVT